MCMRETEAIVGKDGKLVGNFSPESDVTSLQDPFTSRPYKCPLATYFGVLRVKTTCSALFATICCNRRQDSNIHVRHDSFTGVT